MAGKRTGDKDRVRQSNALMRPRLDDLMDGMTEGGDSKDSIVQTGTGEIQVGGYRLTALGLVGDGSRGDWEQVGGLLFDLEGKVQLLIGDWLVEAERKYGETYRQIAEETGRSVNTLYLYKWTADNVPIFFRKKNLTYSHYHLAAGIEDPDRKAAILEQASIENWTVSRLRAEVYPPTLPESVRDNPFDFKIKKRQINRMMKVFTKASTGDRDARREALGWIAEQKKWLEDVAEWLQEE